MSQGTFVYENTINTDETDLEALGSIAGLSPIHKFGFNNDVGSTYEPVCIGGNYQVPTAAVTLQIESDDAQDNSAGTGAREVTIQGLAADWSFVQTTVVPDGLTPVTIDTDFVRVFRIFVSSSGTYATQSAGSHVGEITITDAATGTDIWAVISNDGFPFGQGEISAYTVPKGFKALVKNFTVKVSSAKAVDVLFFQRPNANDIVAPYSGAMRVIARAEQIDDLYESSTHSPYGPFDEYTDIGFMAKTPTSSGVVSTEFEIFLYKK